MALVELGSEAAAPHILGLALLSAGGPEASSPAGGCGVVSTWLSAAIELGAGFQERGVQPWGFQMSSHPRP